MAISPQIDLMNWEITIFDWKNATFEAFVGRLQSELKKIRGINHFGIVAKSKFLHAVSITDPVNWRIGLVKSKDGELKLLLMLGLFADQEQIITNALVEGNINDKQRASLESLWRVWYNRIYSVENFNLDENQIINAFNNKFELVINQAKGKLD